MIQRIQSVYLLLSALSAGMAFLVPFALNPSGSLEMYAKDESIVLTIILLIILESLVCIFLFKKRKLQRFGCWLVVLLSLICVGYMAYLTELKLENWQLNFGALAPVLSLILALLAYIGITKDDKLIKSTDRLR
jgi:peptidoglycan/LPS O-acetylase OafA/YrhL